MTRGAQGCEADMFYSVQIRRLALCAVFDLKGSQADLTAWAGKAIPAFPVKRNSCLEIGHIAIYWIGAGHWLLRSSPEDENRLIEALRPDQAPPSISIVPVSDAYTFFALTGHDLVQLLAVATSLDSSQPREGDATFTEAFGQKALLVMTRDGCELAVDRSYADMIETCLNRAIGID